MPSDFLNDLIDHKRRVAEYLRRDANESFERAIIHDNSKFSPEEYEIYEQAFPELQKHPYGSEQFKLAIQTLGPALEHHYKANSHHPEHFENGIEDMTLFDVREMVYDWMAASHRSQTGIEKGLEINAKRYGIGDQLLKIIKNTVRYMQEKGEM